MRLPNIGMEGVEEYLGGLAIAYSHAASTCIGTSTDVSSSTWKGFRDAMMKEILN